MRFSRRTHEPLLWLRRLVLTLLNTRSNRSVVGEGVVVEVVAGVDDAEVLRGWKLIKIRMWEYTRTSLPSLFLLWTDMITYNGRARLI